MNRRDFFKLLTATPAAFLIGKYGLPSGDAAPKLRHYDPDLVQLNWSGIELHEARMYGGTIVGITVSRTGRLEVTQR